MRKLAQEVKLNNNCNIACTFCANLQNLRIMQNDLISTSEVALLFGKSVATINRWAADGRIKPAVEGHGRTGPRLYSRADIEKILHERLREAEAKVEAFKQAKAAS